MLMRSCTCEIIPLLRTSCPKYHLSFFDCIKRTVFIKIDKKKIINTYYTNMYLILIVCKNLSNFPKICINRCRLPKIKILDGVHSLKEVGDPCQ